MNKLDLKCVPSVWERKGMVRTIDIAKEMAAIDKVLEQIDAIERKHGVIEPKPFNIDLARYAGMLGEGNW